MNAAHPVAHDRQAEQRANEPSMEEILASIRRIIADDQAFTGRGAPPVVANGERAEPQRVAAEVQTPAYEPSAPAAQPAPAVAHHPAAPAAEPSRSVDLGALRGSVHDDAAPRMAPVAPAMSEPTRVAAAVPELALDTPLVSPKTDAAVGNAFSALVASQFMRESEMLPELVRDMLRPMLKMWLDDNLPVIVERLVRVEIERVARGSR